MVDNSRNNQGFKDTINCYRNIDGVKFVSWSIFPSSEYIKKCRLAGATVRKINDTLFVMEKDLEKIESIDTNL